MVALRLTGLSRLFILEFIIPFDTTGSAENTKEHACTGIQFDASQSSSNGFHWVYCLCNHCGKVAIADYYSFYGKKRWKTRDYDFRGLFPL